MTNVLQLFATPIYFSKLDSLTNDIKKIIIDQEFEEMYSGTGSYTKNQNLLNLPELLYVKEEIDRHVGCYAHEILKVKSSQEFYLTTSWAVKHTTGNYANPHIHTNSLISGVFYLDDDKDFGKINFGRTHDNIFTSAISPDFDEFNPLNSTEYAVSPSSGMILLFPSITNHSVSPNMSDKTRYSVSFNYFIKGEFGQKESYLNVIRGNSTIQS
jgi:uncharacterized protein (TIGR02466 family)